MRDFLPADKARRERLLAVIRRQFAQHGFDEIETPVVEDSAHLHAGLGGDNEKLAYAVMRRGLATDDFARVAAGADYLELADLGLRFDLTVPLARFYASHHAELPSVFRSIQVAPAWRAERPQKGRYRQFMQCDIDVIGEPGILAEVELLVATIAALDALGLTGCTIRINDRRLLTSMLASFGFAPSQYATVLITLDKLDKVGAEGVVAELRGRAADIARLAAGAAAAATAGAGERAGVDLGAGEETASDATIDSSVDSTIDAAIDATEAFLTRIRTAEFVSFGERAIRRELPAGVDEDAVTSLVAIGTAMEAAGVDRSLLQFDPFLVRGMGYYTGTIFEVAHPDLGYSLGGGGRYDGMIGRFLGTAVPAAGISLGFERLVDLVQLADEGAAGSVALVYDAEVSAARLATLKAELLVDGGRVRLERRTRNPKQLLEQLAASGFTRFAYVSADQESVDDLEFREIG